MAGETDLHKTLKKEACRWLYRMGYRCIAAEVRLRRQMASTSSSGAKAPRLESRRYGTPTARFETKEWSVPR